MSRIVVIAAAFTLCASVGAVAQAPSVESAAHEAVARAGPSLLGRAVLDAKGEVIGVVEQVTPGPGGEPAQILVRPKGLRAGGPRSLAARSVSLTEKGVQIPLTRAEFEAMPAVRPQAK